MGTLMELIPNVTAFVTAGIDIIMNNPVLAFGLVCSLISMGVGLFSRFRGATAG